MKRFLAPVCAVLFASSAFGQPAAKPREFEVASVKPSDPAARGSSINLDDRSSSLRLTNVPLRDIITFGYNLLDFQLAGEPAWTATERYDIVGKPPAADVTTGSPQMSKALRQERDDQMRERVRALLASRFGLKVHSESREQSVYILNEAKGGNKLKVIDQPGERQGLSSNTGRIQGFAAEMGMLSRVLSNNVRRPVLDKTNLSAKYDFVLEWTPDALAGADTAVVGPTIFTALQEQLGLHLEAAKAPVETIVVDHVERPDAN